MYSIFIYTPPIAKSSRALAFFLLGGMTNPVLREVCVTLAMRTACSEVESASVIEESSLSALLRRSVDCRIWLA